MKVRREGEEASRKIQKRSDDIMARNSFFALLFCISSVAKCQGYNYGE
jgi:hypothetical protein